MDRLKRLERLVESNNIDKINNQTVLVLGLGGVGGYAVESLVRSGIGKIVLVDYDIIDVTNLNRQIISDENNIGESKTKAWEERISKINSDCKIITIEQKITPENIDILFNQNPNYIVDACDSVDTKEALIIECVKRNIKFIASMGTGNKMDPSKLEIIDIRKTSYDPLAKKIRKFVYENKINKRIPVVCSTESPKKIYSPIGSNSFVPATAGLLCASYVINDIVGDLNDID